MNLAITQLAMKVNHPQTVMPQSPVFLSFQHGMPGGIPSTVTYDHPMIIVSDIDKVSYGCICVSMLTKKPSAQCIIVKASPTHQQ